MKTGEYLLRQHDGLLALFSSITSQFVFQDATADDATAKLRERYADVDGSKIARNVRAIVNGNVRQVYPHIWDAKNKKVLFDIDEARDRAVRASIARILFDVDATELRGLGVLLTRLAFRKRLRRVAAQQGETAKDRGPVRVNSEPRRTELDPTAEMQRKGGKKRVLVKRKRSAVYGG